MYITGLQMSHGIGLDGETRHHLDPDNNDEYLGDTRSEFIVNQDIYCLVGQDTEDDMIEAIDQFDQAMMNEPITEGNILDPIDDDDPIIGTFPVVVRYDTTPVKAIPVNDDNQEDMHMSQPKTDQFRLILSSDEIGTHLHAQPTAHDDNTPSKPKSQFSHIQSVLLPFQAQGPMNAKLVAQMANAMQTVCFRDDLDADHPISLARLAAQEIFSSLRNNGKQIWPKSWINALNRGPRVRSMTFDAFCDLVTNATGDTRVALDALKTKAEARRWKTVRVNSNLIAA